MGRLFGTDGVRGLANQELTPELALELGRAAAKQIRKDAPKGRKLRAIVARDTRMSGDFLDHAISSGLASEGVDVNRIGVVTTPCVAYLTAKTDVDLGVMISASHNPMPDNGIKFFARGGYKLPDACLLYTSNHLRKTALAGKFARLLEICKLACSRCVSCSCFVSAG